MKSFKKIKILMHLLLTIIISFSVIFYPVTSGVDANIADKMEQVFSSLSYRAAVTAPGVYKSQTGGILTGGSFVLRGGNALNPPIFQINPPSIKAGCGGVDIFFGAFQYVNAQQLVNMLKNIGQAALGYAFKLGLETVCSACSQVLDALVNFANQLARLAQDSCAIGQLIAKGIFGDPATAAEAQRGQCRLELVAGEESPIRVEQKCDGPGFLNEMAKKLNEWSAGMQKLTIMKIPGSVTETIGRKLGYSTAEIEIMRSFVGDVALVGFKEDQQGEKTIPIHKIHPPTLSLQDIMYGNADAEFITFNTTTNDFELVKKGYLAQGGFKQKVYKLLQDIKEKVKYNQQLTEEEKRFVENCPFPIIPLLNDTTKIPELADSIIDNISDTVAVIYAYSLVEYYIKTVLMNVSNQPHADVKEAYKTFEERRKMLLNELNQQIEVLQGQYTALSLGMFYAKQIRKSIAGMVNNP